MPINTTDSELGRHLLTIRGFHFIFGAQGDPYALLLRGGDEDSGRLGQQARERGQLHRSDAVAWVTASHALGAEILGDPRLSLRHAGADSPQQHILQDVWDNPKVCHVLPLDDAFLNLDRAECRRLLDLAEPALGDQAMRSQGAAAELPFDQAADRLDGEFDLMADFAAAGVVAAVAALFGLSDDERDRLGLLCRDLGVALDAGLCPPQLVTARRLEAAVDGVRALFGELIAARLGGGPDDGPGAGPGKGLVSALLRAAGSAADPARDVLGVCVLTAVVGVDVTANLICNAMAALTSDPQQWALLRADPSLADAAVAETLRHAPPIRMESRIAQRELELAGQTVPADSQIVVLVDAANRDPEVYPAPDRFDIQRAPASDQLCLSGGLHTSLVAPFARAHAAAALRVLASRLPEVRPAGPPLRRMRSPVTRGVLRFPAATR